MPAALVTGASTGIGAEYAVRLAEIGYDLVLVARDAEALAQVAEQVRGYGREAEVLTADLTDPADLDRVAERAAAEDITMLVNNAGSGSPGRFVRSAAVLEQRMLDLNVTAVMRLCHAAFSGMLARDRGSIINVSSVAAYTPSDTGPGYAASKAYVATFTESLAVAVYGSAIRVLCVFPGYVRTSFHPRLGMDTSWIPSWAWLTPPQVVRDSLQDLRLGRTRSVPSARYKIVMALARATPRPLLRRILAGAGKVTARA